MTKETKSEVKFSWKDSFRAFYFLLDKQRKLYFCYSAILIAVLIYDFVPTIIVAKIVDFFTTYSEGESLGLFYTYVISLTISWALVALVRLDVKKRLAKIRIDTTYFTRVRGFERLLDFSVKWHDAENTGNKVQKIQAGSDAAKSFQRVITLEVFTQVTAIVGALSAFLFINPWICLLGIAHFLVFLLIQISFYKRLEQANRENSILLEKASGTYYEGLNNILTIKTLGVKNNFKSNINSRETLSRDASFRKVELNNNKWKSFQVLNALSIGVSILLAGQGFMAGILSLGSILMVANYFQRLVKNINDTSDTFDELVASKITMARMMPIFWEKTAVPGGSESFPLQWNSIDLKNISFTYPVKSENEGIKDVREVGLYNVNLSIAKNQKVGIVGRSGSGKSTLAKMLLGLYESKSGNYQIGGVDFAKIKHDEITHHVALVLQDSEMFNLSLKENITLMRAWNEKLFNKAISICQLEELLAKLPEKENTLIGEKGYRLSGGERQRIGIARAIYKDPQILVLDEATSSLDDKTEIAIQNAIDTQLKEKTIITIAHRISTLKNTDKIIVFEEGKIVEEGTFEELSQNPQSKFFAIYQSESL